MDKVYVRLTEGGKDFVSFRALSSDSFASKFRKNEKIYAAKIHLSDGTSIAFIPNGLLKVENIESNFVLSQNGHRICYVPSTNSMENPLVFDLIPITFLNLKSFLTYEATVNDTNIIEFNNAGGTLIVILISTAQKNLKTTVLSLTDSSWKDCLRDLTVNPNELFVEKLNEKTGKNEQHLVLLGREDVVEYSKKVGRSSLVDGLPETPINEIFVLSEGSTFPKLIAVETCIKFSSRPLFGLFSTYSIPEFEENVKSSFTSTFISDSKFVTDNLVKKLHEEYLKWTISQRKIAAPLVPVCQGSGSGKSRVLIQILKSLPGFYVVLRTERQTGFPSSNVISKEFLDIATFTNDLPGDDLTSKLALDCQVGKFLRLNVRIISSYIRKITDFYLISESTATPENRYKSALEAFGKLFEDNDHLTGFEVISELEMEPLYKFPDASLTVSFVAHFIERLLADPKLALTGIDLKNSLKLEVCELLASSLQQFPFLFVLDEADIISHKTETESISGFQAYRRSLGYLSSTCKFMTVAIGTRGDVTRFNPPVVDPSSRSLGRTELLKTVIFTGNTNIFASKYPTNGIHPTREMLLNPIMFKYLVTRNRPLWGIYPFDKVVPMAHAKIENGSRDTFNFVLPIWMQRAGLTANPLHTNVHSLVANHVATLFSISEDRQRLRIMYPSDPIQAMGCRSVLDDAEYRIKKGLAKLEEALFTKFKEFIESIQVERGNTAESFVAMAISSAIDRAENACVTNLKSSETYKAKLEEIKKATHHSVHGLWEKKSYLFEPENASIPVIFNFPHYKVVTVDAFLSQLYGAEKFGKLKPFLPKETLSGLVNTSHFIRMDRNLPGDQVKSGGKGRSTADSRLADASRNIIDSALLQHGLLNQCGYFMPPSYYGIDLIIPVSLESGSDKLRPRVTFIAVQVKAGPSSLDETFPKMTARLHYVKCPHSPQPEREKDEEFRRQAIPCSQCRLDEENWKEIYRNQISLLISFSERDYKSFIINPEAALKKSFVKSRLLSTEASFKSLWSHLQPELLNQLEKSCKMSVFRTRKKPDLEQSEQSGSEQSDDKPIEGQLSETKRKSKSIEFTKKEIEQASVAIQNIHITTRKRKKTKNSKNSLKRSDSSNTSTSTTATTATPSSLLSAANLGRKTLDCGLVHFIQFDSNIELCAAHWQDSDLSLEGSPMLPEDLQDVYTHRSFSIGSFGWNAISDSFFKKELAIAIGDAILTHFDDLSDIRDPDERASCTEAFKRDSSSRFPFHSEELLKFQGIIDNDKDMDTH